MKASSTSVVVIGAGIVGCSVALELSRSGHTVSVVDKGPGAGSGSTSASSAIVRFNYSTFEGVAASWESMHSWVDWANWLGLPSQGPLARYYKVGMLALEPDEGRLDVTQSLYERVGVRYERLSPTEFASRYPMLDRGRYWPPAAIDDETFWESSDDEVAACFTPDAGFVDDPQLAAENLMNAASASGARFYFNERVSALLIASDRVSGVQTDRRMHWADIVVNAAGPYSATVNQMAGVIADFRTVSTAPLRQEVHVVPAPAAFQLETSGTVVSDPGIGTYFRPHLTPTLLVGGTEPECDPLTWVADPERDDSTPTVETWARQVYRLAKRIPEVKIPNRPVGLAALYDVTPDWTPIYDRTSLDGFYVAIGTSGNQFKNAPLIGRIMRTLIEACEAGADHDTHPVSVRCEHTGLTIGLSHYSRLRPLSETAHNVLG